MSMRAPPHLGGRRLLVMVAAAATLAASTTLLAVTLGASGSSSTSGSRPTFAILKKPTTPLPPGSLTPRLRSLGANPARDARLALDAGAVRLFAVAPSGSRNKICLVVRNFGATVSTCADLALLAADNVLWISHAKPGGVYDLYALAPDGMQRVQAASAIAIVSNNALLLRDVPASAEDITLAGAGFENTVHIGPQVPPGVTIAPDPAS
jgi:hypothetical protein